jgi:hypothetical protein
MIRGREDVISQLLLAASVGFMGSRSDNLMPPSLIVSETSVDTADPAIQRFPFQNAGILRACCIKAFFRRWLVQPALAPPSIDFHCFPDYDDVFDVRFLS